MTTEPLHQFNQFCMEQKKQHNISGEISIQNDRNFILGTIDTTEELVLLIKTHIAKFLLCDRRDVEAPLPQTEDEFEQIGFQGGVKVKEIESSSERAIFIPKEYQGQKISYTLSTYPWEGKLTYVVFFIDESRLELKKVLFDLDPAQHN